MPIFQTRERGVLPRFSQTQREEDWGSLQPWDPPGLVPGWLSFLLSPLCVSLCRHPAHSPSRLAVRGSGHFQTEYQVLGWQSQALHRTQLLLCVTVLGSVLPRVTALCVREELKAWLVRDDAAVSSRWGFPGCPLRWPQSAVSRGSIAVVLSADPHSDSKV